MLAVDPLGAQLQHLVLDFNGTLACDGVLLPGVAQRLRQIAGVLQVHVVTADTFGNARHELAGLPCTIQVLGPDGQSTAKREFVRALGGSVTACIGNGRNDRLMMREAVLAIAVIQAEGAWSETVRVAHVVTTDVTHALDLLQNPRRLLATLRA